MRYTVDQRNASRRYSDKVAKRIIERWGKEKKKIRNELLAL